MIGINTGKVMIGAAYLGKKRDLSNDEMQIQSVLLAEMPGNALNRAAIVSLSPEAYHHIPKAEKAPQSAFKRFRDFLSRVARGAI